MCPRWLFAHVASAQPTATIRRVAMFIWMMLVLKIPIVMLLLLVWWSVKNTGETGEERTEGGWGHGPKRPWPRRPGPPRRGPHRSPAPGSPRRVRVHARRLQRAHSARV